MFENDNHPSFSNKPNAATKVWRYMDLPRYVSLLQSSALHFARADQMSDRWEGSFGLANVLLRPTLYGKNYEVMVKARQGFLEASKRMMYMSCWHVNEHESAAMWDIYQRDGRGIAIASTWGALTASITDDRAIFGGLVTYADYKRNFIPEDNLFGPFMHKRISYAHESEARLMTVVHDESSPNSETLRPASELVVPVAVDLARLVHEVYISPDAPEWITNVVADVTETYGRSFPIQQSDLRRDPIQ